MQQAQVSGPGLAKVGGLGTVSVEGLENGQGIGIRNGNGGDGGGRVVYGGARNARLGWVSGSRPKQLAKNIA